MPYYLNRGDSLEQQLVGMPNNLETKYNQPNSSFYAKHQNSAAAAADDNHCLNLLPYPSISAFLLCLFGVALFTTMMLWAFNATVELVRRTTGIDNLPWLDRVQLMFIISALTMLIISSAFLIIGLLSTGQTREKLFHQAPARRGGRIFCVVALCLASLLCLIWILILAFTAILCFIFTIFSSLCSKINQSSNGNACLDLNFVRPLLSDDYQKTSFEICNGQLNQFCAITNTVVLWYFIGLFGALIICIGLVQFIITNAVNFTQIGNEAKNSELCRIINAELMADDEIRSTKFCNSITNKNNLLPQNIKSIDKFDNSRPSKQIVAWRQNNKQNFEAFQQQTEEFPGTNNKNASIFDANNRRHSYQRSLGNSFMG